MDEAKARHPAGWRPDLQRLRMRMAEVLAAEGVAHPDVAASALGARGALGVDRGCLARLLDVDESAVVAVEGGAVDGPSVPPALQALIFGGVTGVAGDGDRPADQRMIRNGGSFHE